MRDDAPFSFPELIDHFGRETIETYFVRLQQRMENYLIAAELERGAYVCESKLRHVVIDYFSDIYRFEKFHGAEALDQRKIVAYTVFWLLRCQPIQVREECATDERYVFANEVFASALVTYFFANPQDADWTATEFVIPDDERAAELLAQFQKEVLYHLKYRQVDARNLELLFGGYETGFNVARHVAGVAREG